MNSPEQKIQKIIERNKRVEMDKKWETSLVRKLFIFLVTFIGAFLFLKVIHTENALLGACIPAGAYLLSTLLLSPIRKIWEKLQK